MNQNLYIIFESMLFGTKPEEKEKSSKSSDGFISTTSPIKIASSIFLSGDLPTKKQQSQGLLDSPPPKKQKDPPSNIRKISSGNKEKDSLNENKASLLSSSPRKKTHTQKQSQLLISYPRLVNNADIVRSIRAGKSLSDEQVKKILINYVFYIRDKQLTAEYQKLKKETECFKINMLKGVPLVKDKCQLIGVLVEVLSSILNINPIAALDIMQMYIIENQKKFKNLSTVQMMIAAGILKKNQKNIIQANLQHQFIKNILLSLQVIYKSQINELQIIFLEASKTKFKLFKSKTEIQTCSQNLWQSFMYYYMSSPLKHQKTMQQIILILTSLVETYQQEFNAPFIISVLEVSDQCLTKSYLNKQILLNFIIKLFRLDCVNLITKGIHIDPKENIFNQRGKEVRNLITKLSSYELLPFKVILPQIDESLQNSRGCIEVPPSYQVPIFGQNKNEIVLQGSYWLDWLQLWIYQLKEDCSQQLFFVALRCLLNCFSENYELFWLSNHSKRFCNIKWLLKESQKNGYSSQIFQILQKLVGKQKPYAQQTYDLALEIFQRQEMRMLLKSVLFDHQLHPSAISCVRLVCKLVALDSKIVQRLQKDIFNKQEQGLIVIYLLQFLNRTNDQQSVEYIFYALNNMLLNKKIVTLQQMRIFQQDNSLHRCLKFLQDGTTLCRNKNLLEALCDHFNILIAQPKSVEILQQKSQWLNSFRVFQPWKIKNSFTTKCIRYLLKRWSIDPRSFWNNSLQNISATDLFYSILNHNYTKYQSRQVFENQIVYDFLLNPKQVKNIEKIELLTETLLLLQQGLKTLEKNKIRQYRPGMPSIVEGILFTFVLDMNPSRIVESSWWQTRKQVHPFLVFIYLLNIPQSAIKLIQKVTFVNISELAINILSKILKLNNLQFNDHKSNQLLDLLRSDSPLGNIQHGDDMFTLIKNLLNKIKSGFMIANIIDFMIHLSYVEKLLLKEILKELKNSLIQSFIEVSNSHDLETKSKMLILLLRICSEKSIYQQFINSVYNNTILWVSLTNQQIVQHSFISHDLEEQIKNSLNGQKINIKFLKQNLIRLSIISNTCQLLLILFTSSQKMDIQNSFKAFFQIFSQNNLYILFKNSSNFNPKLLEETSTILKFVPQSLNIEINNFIMNLQNFNDQPQKIIKTIISSNTLAYNNWTKLYIAIINPNRLLNATKQITSKKEFDKVLTSILMMIANLLNEGKIQYTVYIYYMLGLGIQIMKKQSYPLINQLMADMRWLNFKEIDSKNGVLFLMESVNRVQYKNQKFKQIVEILLKKDKFITPQTFTLLTKNNVLHIFEKTINQLLNSKNNLLNFVISCQSLIFQLTKSEMRADGSSFSPVRIADAVCESITSMDTPIQQVVFYRGQKRDVEHIRWCWALNVMITLNTYSDSQSAEKFHELVIRRLETILRQLENNSDAFVLTRGFKQQIELISSYFVSLLFSRSSFIGKSINIVHRLWKKIMYLIMRFKHIPITNFEKCLYQTISIDPIGGLYSMRSVSPYVSYATTPQSYRPEHGLKSKSSTISKGKLDVAAGDLLEEVSTHQILLNILTFIKATLSQSILVDQSYIQWQQFVSTLEKTFQRVMQFFQRSFGVMAVKDLLKTLNNSISTLVANEDRGYLNTLRQPYTIEGLAQIAKTNIFLINDIFSNHLNMLADLSKRQPIQNHVLVLLKKIERMAEILVRHKQLARDSIFLKNKLKQFGIQFARRSTIIPNQSKFLSSVMSKMRI